MKEKLIELFKKIGNETDTFAPFITCDEFENLADEIVKLCNLHCVINWVACSEREPDEEGIYYVYPDKYHYTAEYHKYGKWAGKWTVDDQNGYEYETVVKYWKRITPPCL